MSNHSVLKLALDKTFNPEFIGRNWAVWRGPANGNGLEGEEYLPEPEPGIVDFEQVVLETHLLKKGSIQGEEKMRRARRSKNKQLGGSAFLALWNNWQECKRAGKPEDSILERLRKSGKIGKVIYFFGLVLRDPDGSRSVLGLFFGGREWDWYFSWLDDHWDVGNPSVSLATFFIYPFLQGSFILAVFRTSRLSFCRFHLIFQTIEF